MVVQLLLLVEEASSTERWIKYAESDVGINRSSGALRDCPSGIYALKRHRVGRSGLFSSEEFSLPICFPTERLNPFHFQFPVGVYDIIFFK
jgi:hypothetical protein